MIPTGSDYSSVQHSGSPQTGEPVFLAVGKLRHPHGVRGEILMDVLTDFPERIQRGVTLLIGEEHLPLRVMSSRWHRSKLLLTFEGYDTPETVGVFRNQIVFVRTEETSELPEGEFYQHQLLGLQAFTTQGKLLGSVIDILETGANDVFVIQGESGPEILIPYVDDIVPEVNLKTRRLIIQPIPGLLPDEEA
jgi:16S rRNA processing protein RimM